ncbi:MAG: hypothetical protein RLZZ142_159 [Verrucomicrobiota bacterium]
MKKRIKGVLGLLLGGTLSLQAQLDSEFVGFLERQLKSQPPFGDEKWVETGGGYLLMADADLDRDGIPERLWSVTGTDCSRDVNWFFYSKAPSGNWKPMFLHATLPNGKKRVSPFVLNFIDGLSLDDSGGKCAVIQTAHERVVDGKYWRLAYVLEKGRARLVVKEADSNLGEQGFENDISLRKIRIEVRGILLADFLRYPNTEWRRIDFSKASFPNRCLIVEGDMERVARLQDFTPEVALRWLKTARMGREPEGDTSVYDLAMAPVSGAKHVPAVSEEAPAGEGSPGKELAHGADLPPPGGRPAERTDEPPVSGAVRGEASLGVEHGRAEATAGGGNGWDWGSVTGFVLSASVACGAGWGLWRRRSGGTWGGAGA